MYQNILKNLKLCKIKNVYLLYTKWKKDEL